MGFRIKLGGSLAHFKEGMKPEHGPQSWPWWRVLSFQLCKIDAVSKPHSAYRLWFYTKFGAGYVEAFFIRG